MAELLVFNLQREIAGLKQRIDTLEFLISSMQKVNASVTQIMHDRGIDIESIIVEEMLK